MNIINIIRNVNGIEISGLRQNSTEPLFTPTQFIWTKLIATYYIEYLHKTHLLIFVVIYVNIVQHVI